MLWTKGASSISPAFEGSVATNPHSSFVPACFAIRRAVLGSAKLGLDKGPDRRSSSA